MLHHPLRSMNRPVQSYSPIEPLESRTLLSKALATGVFDVTKVPVYQPTNNNLADVENGPMANAGTHLASLYLDYRRATKSGRNVNVNALQYRQLLTDGQRVGVT